MESIESSRKNTSSQHLTFRARHETPMHGIARAFQWADSELGPPASWPTSLRTIVGVVLGSQFPLSVWWGRDLIHLYNEAFRPILGDKHPHSFAAAGAQIWGRHWKTLGKYAQGVMAGGPAVESDRIFLPVPHGSAIEETYCRLSYSPIPDDAGNVGGVLVACRDVTEQVHQSRQLRTLRDLAARAMDAHSEESAYELVMEVLEENARDIPFALAFSCDDDRSTAALVASCRMTGHTGAASDSPASLLDESGAWPLRRVAETLEPVMVDDLFERLGELPGGAWELVPSRAVCLPLVRPTQNELLGFLVCGVSPCRVLDEAYLSFFNVIADELASALASGRAFQSEHRRAVTAAELGVRSVLLERELEESRDHDRRKDEYLAMLAHELRNPLAPLQIALHVLRQTGDLTGDAPRHVEIAQRQVGNLSRIVSDLLDVSRLTQGKIELCKQTLDLQNAVQAAIDSARDVVTEQHHELEFVPPDEVLYVRADAVRLEQIFVNLLTNAAKYTDPGGHIRVLVEREVSHTGGSLAVVRIQDDGIGIPLQMQRRLFDLFEQGGRNTSRRQGGLGIGLTIVRNLVELHGGTVSVRSQGRDKGSEFIVRLPEVAAPSREMRALPREIAPGTIPSRRVLVVDDNTDMADMVAELLTTAGHEAIVAYDGESALARAIEWKPDVVFLDLGLPRMSGLDVARAIRGYVSEPPYLVALTGLGRDSDIRATRTHGFHEHLVKPPAVADLLRALARSTQGA